MRPVFTITRVRLFPISHLPATQPPSGLRDRARASLPPHPLSPQGRKWWMGAEEPWQTLACCMEVANAVRASDPAAYVSHLPVHQVSQLGRAPEAVRCALGLGLDLRV